MPHARTKSGKEHKKRKKMKQKVKAKRKHKVDIKSNIQNSIINKLNDVRCQNVLLKDTLLNKRRQLTTNKICSTARNNKLHKLRKKNGRLQNISMVQV